MDTDTDTTAAPAPLSPRTPAEKLAFFQVQMDQVQDELLEMTAKANDYRDQLHSSLPVNDQLHCRVEAAESALQRCREDLVKAELTTSHKDMAIQGLIQDTLARNKASSASATPPTPAVPIPTAPHIPQPPPTAVPLLSLAVVPPAPILVSNPPAPNAVLIPLVVAPPAPSVQPSENRHPAPGPSRKAAVPAAPKPLLLMSRNVPTPRPVVAPRGPQLNTRIYAAEPKPRNNVERRLFYKIHSSGR
ncbi:MAG: hypothetical protein GY696_16380, partial [Gammaproteobacteria bacterium]|nr:hypothetical protein [Gammaproteobacteria bacterium]